MTEQDALNEIRRQLAYGGNHVWIDNWRARFGHVASSPKELMLNHPDEFAITFEGGNKFSVTLVRRKPTPPSTAPPWRRMTPAATQRMSPVAPVATPRIVPPRYPALAGKARGKGAATAALPAPEGTEEDAVREIRRQLKQRGDGKMWIQDWHQRFKALAKSPREFLEARPDLFLLTFDENNTNKFTTEWVGDDEVWGEVEVGGGEEQAAEGNGWKKRKWEIAKVSESTEEEATTETVQQRSGHTVPPRYPALAAKTQRQGAATFALPAPEGTEEDAVREIRQQLKRRGNGKMWIQDWHQRFKALAKSPREFLEARPELFLLTFDENNTNKFTTEWIGDDEVWGEVEVDGGEEQAVEGNGWKKRKWVGGTGDVQPVKPKIAKVGECTEEEAMTEIAQQLSDPKNTENKVWISGWGRRFSHLGTLREFMESHPERFAVIPGNGRSYTVMLLDLEE